MTKLLVSMSSALDRNGSSGKVGMLTVVPPSVTLNHDDKSTVDYCVCRSCWSRDRDGVEPCLRDVT